MRTLLLLAALVAAALVSTTAMSAEPAAPLTDSFTGMVGTIDGRVLVVKNDDRECSARVTPLTKIMRGGDVMKFEDLKVGLTVTVEYAHKEGKVKEVSALNILILPAPTR